MKCITKIIMLSLAMYAKCSLCMDQGQLEATSSSSSLSSSAVTVLQPALVKFSAQDVERANEDSLCGKDIVTAREIWRNLSEKMGEKKLLNIIADFLPSPEMPNPLKITLKKDHLMYGGFVESRAVTISTPHGAVFNRHWAPLGVLPQSRSSARGMPDIPLLCENPLKYIMDVQPYSVTSQGPNYTGIERNQDYIRMTLAVCLEACNYACTKQPQGRMLITVHKGTGAIFGMGTGCAPAIKVLDGCPPGRLQATHVQAERINDTLCLDAEIIPAKNSLDGFGLGIGLYPPFNPRTCAALQDTCPGNQPLHTVVDDSKKCLVS